jgi:hypothetical protein
MRDRADSRQGDGGSGRHVARSGVKLAAARGTPALLLQTGAAARHVADFIPSFAGAAKLLKFLTFTRARPAGIGDEKRRE